MSNKKVLAVVRDANVLATTIAELRRITERSEDKKRRERKRRTWKRTGRTKESELPHEYLGSRTPAMEYLFVDAGFISLNEERRRETKSLCLRQKSRRLLKGTFPMGDPRGRVPSIAFHVRVWLKYCCDLLTKRH